MMLASSSTKEAQFTGEFASEKRSLASILRTHGPLSITDAVDIALDICDELANAHANGVVHGDLGPHRVRLTWPRSPRERVEIFTLDETDSAAFALRASAIAVLVAPEQRKGRMVDLRADVWAVGALLHWMIANRPPRAGLAEGSLGNAPGVVVATIESCLAHDPAKRPQSVDELAQGIGSLASSPPQRFEVLARRRAAREAALRARSGPVDVSSALGRLDDAALSRELLAASDGVTHGSVVARSVAERILAPNQRSTAGSVVIPKPTLDLRPPPLPRFDVAPAEPEVVGKTEPLVAPKKMDSLVPVAMPPPASTTMSAPAVSAVRMRKPALIAAASIAAVVFGVAIGMRIVGDARPTVTAAAKPAETAAPPPAVSASAEAPTPSASASSAATATDAVPVLTLESLSNVKVVTVHSLPNMPVAPRAAAVRVRVSPKEEKTNDESESTTTEE